MNIHTTTGRWRLGLALSAVTALLWGIVPIALKVLLERMDAYTITWYRFSFSAVLLMFFILYRNGLSYPLRIKNHVPALIAIAASALCGNYILYVIGLDHISPSTATVVIQMAPIFMLFGSMIVFRERFSLMQWTGFVVLVLGLALFFNNRLEELFYRHGNYMVGVLLVVASGAAWAIYALAQKQLLKSFSSKTIMFMIYITGTVIFLPSAQPGSLYKLDAIGILLLVFCAINTLVAYGCFAEALDHWEASRVSMILATIPLITMAGMKICSLMFPGFVEAEQLNYISIAGGFLVVAGSMLCVLSSDSSADTG